MELPSLTGAQKSQLRGHGQTMPDSILLGREGVTPAFIAELERTLTAQELVKLRFPADRDRHARSALCDQLANTTASLCVGTVGRTALFWRPGEKGSRLLA